jgi:hypothetical protein
MEMSYVEDAPEGEALTRPPDRNVVLLSTTIS